MTISNDNNKNGPYSGNGVTTRFERTFRVKNASELHVYETTLGVTTEVTTGITKEDITLDTGDVVFDTAPATGTTILLIREKLFVQETDYSAQGKVSPEQVEDDVDETVMLIQDLNERLARAISVDPESDNPNTFTPLANTFLAFNALLQPFASPGVSGAPTSPYMATLLDDVDPDEAKSTLEIDIIYDTVADLRSSTEAPRGVDASWEVIGGIIHDEVSTGEDFTTDGGVKLKLRSFKQHVMKSTPARLADLLRNGGLKMAVLGDSTEAGVGGSGWSVYGQCSGIDNAPNGNRFAFELMRRDQYFTPVDPRWNVRVQDPFTASGGSFTLAAFPVKNAQFIATLDQVADFTIEQTERVRDDRVTLYYMERTSDAAARVRVRVFDADTAALLATETIDSYVASENFGAVGAVGVGGRLASAVITCSSPARTYNIIIDSCDVIDRGSGLPADGTMAVFGAAIGAGIKYKNFAVSSTTLTDPSAANTSRGITTAGRLAAAQAMNANVFLIGFGTNDSKTGVTTVDAFRSDYETLIDDIRAVEPNAAIILATDPEGLAPPYDNNTIYNEVIRGVALDKSCEVLDVEALFDEGPATYYADDVHPNDEGYTAIFQKMSALLPQETSSSVIYSSVGGADNLDNVFTWSAVPEPFSDFGGSFVVMHTIDLDTRHAFNYLKVDAKLVFVKTSAYIDMESRIQITGYPEIAQGGTPVGPVVLDETLSGAALTSGLALSLATLGGVHSLGNLASYRIEVAGKNCQLRGGSARSWLSTHWLY